MDTREVERILSRIESLLELHGENSFKSRAYGRAARSLRAAGIDVVGAVERGEPIEVDGIGTALAAEIEEIVRTGTSSQLEDLMERTPNGLLDVMSIRGLGAKKVQALWHTLGVESLDDLEEKARGGEVAGMKGFGKKSQENILAGIAELKSNIGKLRLHTATELAAALLEVLRALPGVSRAEIAGRLRRGGEEFSALEFVLETAAGSDAAGIEANVAAAGILSAVRRIDSTIAGTLNDTYNVFLHVVDHNHFVAALHQKSAASDYRFMLSIPLHDRGYELTEDGLYSGGELVPLKAEAELYERAGMQFIPPELREGIDEIRRALDNELPTLVEDRDLKGILHVHSVWSDGHNTISDLADRAHALGYSYLLMCDHSKAAFYANGLDENRLASQGYEIDEVNKRFDPAQFRVLKGIECDILADGSLDLADDALAALDAVVISVHSNFNLSEDVQTERVCRALENRYATILAHPTGRLILTRKGYPIDLKRVITHAAEHRKYVELNANPYRLDLNWRMVRYAKRKGVKVAIDPDAHSMPEFDYLRYGVTIARKGWLAKEDVLNALSLDDFLSAVKRSQGVEV